MSGRQPPEEVEPLQVAVEGGGSMHIVRGHRRALALSALQGIWRHQTVWAPCHLFDAKDQKVASHLQTNRDTLVDGFGTQLHGHQREAWHMGKPLFRVAEEWCDEAVPMSAITDSCAPGSRLDMSQSSEASGNPMLSHGPSTSLQSTSIGGERFVCCGWLARECSHHGQHFHGNKVFLHEDVSGLPCNFGEWCHYKHHESRNRSQMAHPPTSDIVPGVQHSMLLRVNSGRFGEVVEIEGSRIRLSYRSIGAEKNREDEWIPLDQLQIPDFSSLHPATKVSVCCGGTTYYCTVLEVCRSGKRLRAPVRVHYESHSSDDDEWIGIDRLRTKHLKFRPLKEFKDRSSIATSSSSWQVSLAECLPKDWVELECGMIVMVNTSGQWICGEILEMSLVSEKDPIPVKVRFGEGDRRSWRQVAWFSLDSLKVPDFSALQEGMQGSVKDTYGNRCFQCRILQVSPDKDTATPFYVHYDEYGSQWDEWVGADRFQSQSLRFLQAKLPAIGVKVQLPKGQPSNAGQTALAVQQPREIDSYRRSSSQHCRYEPRCVEPVELQCGMIVLVNSNGSRMWGEVLQLAMASDRDPVPVRVRYGEGNRNSWRQTAWFSLKSLQVPHISSLRGMPGSVMDVSTKRSFQCTVQEVSPNRLQDPLYVHYDGFGSHWDEWVGADRFQSQSLRFLQAKLPAIGVKVQLPKGPPSNAGQTATSCPQGPGTTLCIAQPATSSSSEPRQPAEGPATLQLCPLPWDEVGP